MGGAFIDERHLAHAMERAELVSTGVRVRMDAGTRDRVIIVRNLTVEQVKEMHASPGGSARMAKLIREASGALAFG
jgi:hypothetical protein